MGEPVTTYEPTGSKEAIMFQRTLWRVVIPFMVIALACNFSSGPAPATGVATGDAISVTNTIKPNQPVSFGTVYYVRPDGGSSEQCTGLADASYPGSGANQPCAWDHPFRALPPGEVPRLSGGDTLLVAAGAYKMGFGAPGAETCDEAASFDCHMPPIPNGPSPEHPTRILGAGWDSGCSD